MDAMTKTRNGFADAEGTDRWRKRAMINRSRTKRGSFFKHTKPIRRNKKNTKLNKTQRVTLGPNPRTRTHNIRTHNIIPARCYLHPFVSLSLSYGQRLLTAVLLLIAATYLCNARARARGRSSSTVVTIMIYTRIILYAPPSSSSSSLL